MKFFYHYNKPASKSAGKPQATIHFKGECHIVDSLEINVPTYSKVRKQQPVFIICGKATNIIFERGKAIIS